MFQQSFSWTAYFEMPLEMRDVEIGAIAILTLVGSLFFMYATDVNFQTTEHFGAEVATVVLTHERFFV